MQCGRTTDYGQWRWLLQAKDLTSKENKADSRPKQERSSDCFIAVSQQGLAGLIKPEADGSRPSQVSIERRRDTWVEQVDLTKV